MTTDQPNPPPFYCPACGRKHRADLRALEDKSGAIARVTCARCEAVMTLTMGADALPKCEVLLEAPSNAASKADPTVTAPGGSSLPSGGVMSKPNPILQLVTAAVVAAVVSFALLNLAGDKAPTGTDDTALAALRQQVSEMKSALGEAREEVARERAARAQLSDHLRASLRSVQDGLNAQSKTVTAVEAQQTETRKALDSTRTDYRVFNGRIEGNYTSIRALDKRLKRVESK